MFIGANYMKLDFQDKLIMAAAFISFLFSISLWFGILGDGNRDTAIFVGLWVPSILALGLYGTIARRVK
jgi:hypothetical protein